MTGTPTRYEIRVATDNDLLGAVRLHERDPGINSELLTDRQREAWRDMLAMEGLRVYLAEANREVIGMASMLVMPNLGYDCHPTAFIEAVVVAEDQRRRGIGRRIVERALDDARAASCQKIQLLSHKRHATDGAHAFYRSLGFEPEAEGFRLYLDTDR